MCPEWPKKKYGIHFKISNKSTCDGCGNVTPTITGHNSVSRNFPWDHMHSDVCNMLSILKWLKICFSEFESNYIRNEIMKEVTCQ